jgi:hypothetical protein
MKKLISSLQVFGLTLATWTATAQPALQNLNTKEVSTALNQYVTEKHSDQWFAYSIPAADNTASMCCFNQGKQSVCDLNQAQHGFGSSSDSPYTENIHVFVHLDKGKVDRIMPVGDHCAVKAAGLTVDWLNNVSDQQSIQWLKDQVINHYKQGGNDGLYVLSLHPDQQAAQTLFDLAEDNAGEYSHQAVFWLGQRQQDGFVYLKSLYESLPVSEIRRQVNFALSQNKHADAIKLLQQIAQHDKDQAQQADAIFWLSQTDHVADLPTFLVGLLSATDNSEIKEKAIFSLSQINNAESNQALTNLAKDHKDVAVREKALFWLAQNSPEQAQKAALNILDLGGKDSELENAVFVLSQLPSQQSSAALFAIVKGDYPRNIKKKAIFWLTQSDDEAVLTQLEQWL